MLTKGYVSVTYLTISSAHPPTTTVITLIIICVVCLSSLHLQNPLATASQYGHIEIVDMLLQAKGIDINKGVSNTQN